MSASRPSFDVHLSLPTFLIWRCIAGRQGADVGQRGEGLLCSEARLTVSLSPPVRQNTVWSAASPCLLSLVKWPQPAPLLAEGGFALKAPLYSRARWRSGGVRVHLGCLVLYVSCVVRHSRTVRTYSYFSAFACISYVHTHTGTECAVYMHTLHMCWHTPAHNIQRTHTHYLEVWPRPLATQLAGCRSECVPPALSPSAALLQDGCLLAALHHRAPTNGN